MEKENKSLSEKREKHYKDLLSKGRWLYPEEDIKEAVKRLKKKRFFVQENWETHEVIKWSDIKKEFGKEFV